MLKRSKLEREKIYVASEVGYGIFTLFFNVEHSCVNIYLSKPTSFLELTSIVNMRHGEDMCLNAAS